MKKETKETFRIQKYSFINLHLKSGKYWMFGTLPGLYKHQEAMDIFEDFLPTKEEFEELEKSCIISEFHGLYTGQSILVDTDGKPLKRNGKIIEMQSYICNGRTEKEEVKVSNKNKKEGFILFKNDCCSNDSYFGKDVHYTFRNGIDINEKPDFITYERLPDRGRKAYVKLIIRP